jgi:preprotein translocase SecF subunit
MKLIPDDINLDFMGARKKAFLLSGTLVLASLLTVAVMGLNKGIDFKGGSSVIVEFKDGELTDTAALEASVAQLVNAELGSEATQVSVQTFDSGVQSQTEAGVPINRYIIYTEATSLISGEKKKTIANELEATFKVGDKAAKAKFPAEGSDVYYLSLPEKRKVKEVEAKIRALLSRDCAKGEAGTLCYQNLRVTSDIERPLDVGNVKALNLRKNEMENVSEAAKEELREIEERQLERKEAKLGDAVDKRFTITIEELKSKLQAHLKTDFGDSFVQVASSTSVSPSVGEALLNDGLLAILYAIIGILIYITLRFDFRFAPGAVVALVHDVIITIGLFSLFQVKFSLPIIAALLTIVGYSLNDTIVVLDRVRETFTDFKGADLKVLLNRAINNTLSRTVLTSITTMLVVACILLFGGGLIRDFAWALFIGIIVGTYSSIFIASPLVHYMDIYLKRREEAQKKAGSLHQANPAGA